MAEQGDNFEPLIEVLRDAVTLVENAADQWGEGVAAEKLTQAAEEVRDDHFNNLRADLAEADETDLAAAGFSRKQREYKVAVAQALLAQADPEPNTALTEERVNLLELAINTVREILNSLKKLSVWVEGAYELLGVGLNTIKAAANRTGASGLLRRLWETLIEFWRRRGGSE